MALDPMRLGQTWWTTVKSLQDYGDSLTAEADAKGLELWTALATDMVNEVVQNAEVVVVVDSVTGVTPGSGTSGPGEGTGEVT